VGQAGIPDPDLARFADLDRRLVEAARPIRILGNLNWPARVYDEFVRGFKAGRPALPRGRSTIRPACSPAG